MSGSPFTITFDPDKARAWMLHEDNRGESPVESFLDNDDWGREHDLGDGYADDISDLLATLPADVLNVPGRALQLDGLHDEFEHQCRVILTLHTGVAIAGYVEQLRHFMPNEHDYAAGLVSADDPTPQLQRLMHAIQDIVSIGNSLLDGLYRVLGDVAEHRAEYIASAPDGGQREALEAEVGLLRQAANVVVGDIRPLYGLLPSHRWTPAMLQALPVSGR